MFLAEAFVKFYSYKRILIFVMAILTLALSAGQARADGPPAPLEDHSIRWMKWGGPAFDAAKSSGKLIYLDISATWCRWCREMETRTYTDPRVIETLNSDFIPVLVDTDERPDINDRYNQGGWPSVALLTPTGRVLAGKTYMSADDLLVLLAAAKQAYVADRDRINLKIEAAEKAALAAREEKEKAQDPVPLNPEMPFRVLNSLNLFVDPEFGGYATGGQDKFPMSEVIEFGLYLYPKVREFKQQSPGTAVKLTLNGMADGLQDKDEGGFFRYSTTVDWKTPHYEKLLSVNGDLLGVYMQASQLFDESKYRKVGESVGAYLEATLYDRATGAFFNSQAADERYYKMDKGDRRAIKAPQVDRAVYADSNARAALGYLHAYRATGDDRYLKTGLGVVDYITGRLYRKGTGVVHSEGATADTLLLPDQLYFALAAEQACQATGETKYLSVAVDTAGLMVKKFWDADKGGFYDVSDGGGAIGLLKDRKKPQIENSKAATLMMDLFHLTGQEVYKQTARRTLAPFTTEFMKYTFWAAPFALAVERCIEPTYEFIVVGRCADKGTAELIKKSYTYEDPDRVVVLVDPDRDIKRLEGLGYEPGEKPVLYVCSEKACFPPVSPDDSMKNTREYIRKARAQEKK